MTDDKDYYAILGVVPTAEAALIKAAYRTLSKLYHPDTYQGHDAKQKMSDLNEAYAVLSDAGKRKRYDDARGDRSHGDAEFSSDSPTAESGADRSRNAIS
jgi:curved DNA-binding protein CbpA